MSSKSVAKTVAKKLKYYVDVKRREDAFDLSGPYLPHHDPVPLRNGPTLQYNGLHDRSLKHYFKEPKIKQQIQQLRTVPLDNSRERAVRDFVDQTMASYDYRLKPGPISPYAFSQMPKPKPPPHRPNATMSVHNYFKTKKGAKRRKIPVDVVGKPKHLLRRSPPQYIGMDERERLVNMATKLIVATETVALPQKKLQTKGLQTNEKEFPQLKKVRSTSLPTGQTVSSDSEGSVIERGRAPRPPKGKRAVSATAGRSRRPQSSFFKSSSSDSQGNHRVATGVHVIMPGRRTDSDDERLRSLVNRMNLDDSTNSGVTSPRQQEKMRPKSASNVMKKTIVPTGEDHSYDDDHFYDGGSPSARSRSPSPHDRPRTPSPHSISRSRTPSPCRSRTPSPRGRSHSPQLSWIDDEKHHDGMVDISTQTVVHSGTQTAKFYDYEDGGRAKELEIPARNRLRGTTNFASGESATPSRDKKVAFATATEGSSTANAVTMETQTRNRDLEPKVVTYEIYVVTGDKLGAGTKATVKATIFGEYGSSGERPLLRSRTHRTKFQRDQVDMFVVDAMFLGKLTGLRIGHGETRLGYGWFLDRVYVKEGPEATRAFEFRCNRWFSSRDDDGQIVRDLPLHDVIPSTQLAAVLPRIQERQDDDFFSRSESESSDEESSSGSEESEQEHETKPIKKTKKKTKSREKAREKEIVGSKAVKAEKVVDVSDSNDEKEEKDIHSFFEPEEKTSKEPETGTSTNEMTTSQKQKGRKKPKEERSSRSESSSESEDSSESETSSDEETSKSESSSEDDESEKKDDRETEGNRVDDEDKMKPEKQKKGADHLRLVTTAVSPFVYKHKKKQSEASSSHVDENHADDYAGDKPQEHENTRIRPRDGRDSDEEEKVERFKGEDASVERPSSAHSTQSDGYMEGFKAGVKAEYQRERIKHKESVTHSEEVIKKGKSIHEAAKDGDLERVKELVEVNPFMKNAKDARGMAPVHLSSSKGHIDCVKWLAVSGVDLAEETPTGYTAMHLAAMNGHVNCMMILSAMGSTVSCRTVDEQTPLHLAAMSGHIECVKWLLANRCRTGVLDINQRTPLDVAEEYGHEEIVKLLKKFRKELERQDSTLAQLMTSKTKCRKSVDSTGSDVENAPSKVSDSGVGGLGSDDDSWISDPERDEPSTRVKDNNRPSSGTERPSSASRNRTDSITTVEEKKKLFQKQRAKMERKGSSFLDSIRMAVDDEEEF